MKALSAKSAFTLPEVVITSILILVVMLPISNIGFSIMRNTRFARDLGSAIAIGQQRLELFADLHYDDIVPGNDTVDGFTLRWTVTEADETKIVRLVVSWTILNQNRGIELNTVYPSNLNAGFSFQ